MTQTAQRPRVADIVKKYGHCLELVSMDPHFHEISVGLFIKGRLMTVWSFSTIEGVEDRLRQIRDHLVGLGELETVEGVSNQLMFPTEYILEMPLKFLFKEAVEGDPNSPLPSGPISASDNKSRLTFFLEGEQQEGRYVYTVRAEGEANRPEMRVRAVVGGFMRYAQCERVAPDKFVFPGGARHDGIARLLLTYARNVSAVDNMLKASEMAGQMTTQTLGFSQT
ncbi:MAG: hypothetical protein WD208_02135 [Dehalococcoidia bacterium]